MGSSKSDEIRAKKYFLGEIGNSPLVNKLDIDNQQELDEAEAYFVENALANGLSEKAKELSPHGLKQMHKELFGELYLGLVLFVIIQLGVAILFVALNLLKKKLQKSMSSSIKKSTLI